MTEILNITPDPRTGKLPLYKAGNRYDRLTLTGKSFMDNQRRKLEYICECGNIGWRTWDSLNRGERHSCGCLNKEMFKAIITSHGLARHPLYSLWHTIKNRCYNLNDPAYPKYGGANPPVIVCEEWKKYFKPFYEWAMANGWKRGLDIDKDKLAPTKPGRLYSPEFCCFLTREENVRNRSITEFIEYNSEVKPMAEWCEIFNIKYTTLFMRINKYKWPIELALTIPANRKYKRLKELIKK